MKHPGMTATRTPFLRTIILCLASTCLFALLFITQKVRAADTPNAPDNLGSISGVVTDTTGAPIANMDVFLYSSTSGYSYSSYIAKTKTDLNGVYHLSLLPPGIYLLQLHDPDNHYAAQWYAHSLFKAQATEVIVAGNQITGVNIGLTLGGHLTGTVTVQQAGPATGGYVSLYTQQDGQWQALTTNPISNTGQYVSDALLPGVYRICAAFQVVGAGYALTGCYGGPDVAHATDVSLLSSESKPDLNFDIGEGEFNGVLSGVASGDMAPRAGIKVTAYADNFYGPSVFVYNFTDAAGRYTIGGLAEGRYRLRFSDPAGVYATTYYTNFQFLDAATSIVLSDSQVISNLNVTLPHGGALQGNVHLYTGTPVSNTYVALLKQTDIGFGFAWRLTEFYTATDAVGNYTFHGLWPGIYRVGIQCYAYYENPCSEYYGSKLDAVSAKDVVVQGDQTTAGIDVTFGIENPIFLPAIMLTPCDLLCKLADPTDITGSFKTLLAALHATGLDRTLRSPGTFTLFAPTDAAFASLPKGALEQLMANPSGQLTDIMGYHILNGSWSSAVFQYLSPTPTLQGKSVKFTVDGDSIKVNEANLIVKDIYVSDGVIHVIDRVLIPPTE